MTTKLRSIITVIAIISTIISTANAQNTEAHCPKDQIDRKAIDATIEEALAAIEPEAIDASIEKALAAEESHQRKCEGR